MSFARAINKIIDRSEGKIRGVSLIDSIHKELLNTKPVSKRALIRLSGEMRMALKDSEIEESLEMFNSFYDMMLRLRPRPEHVFHPSSILKDCPRMLWFDINHVPKTEEAYNTFPAEILLTFDLGLWFHHYAQQKLKAAGVLVKPEVRVYSKEWKVDGRMDGLLSIPEKALLEIKTMNSFQFKKACVVNRPFDKDIKQAGLYAHFEKIDLVYFLYFNKDTSEMREFLHKVNPEDNEPMLEKMEKILKAKSPPKCDNSKECKCAWKAYCSSYL